MSYSYRPLDYLTSAKQLDLEEQLKVYHEELEKKDEVIRTLTRLRRTDDSTSDVIKNSGLSKVTEYGDRLTAKESSSLQLRGDLARYKGSDVRQASLIPSIQEFPATAAGVKPQANFSTQSIQSENQALRDRISELEERLRLHLRERELCEQKVVSLERRLDTGIENLALSLNTDPGDQRDPLEFLIGKVSDLVQEHLQWETRIATLEETLTNQELEFRAGRQTLMKLVSDADKAQKEAVCNSQDVRAIRKEMDEALLQKKAVEQENKALRDRLADCQRTLGTAFQAQALNEKRVSDLDDCLHSSTYQAKTAVLLHQSFLEQLAALLSDGFTRIPATEEAIKSKVKEICSNHQTHAAKVKGLEERVMNVNRQLEHQSDIYHQVLARAQRAEERLTEREEMLRHLRGQLAAKDLLKDACQFDRQKLIKFLQQLADRMKLEQDRSAEDWDTQSQQLLDRARQLVDEHTEDQNLLQKLQRKVTAQKEKLVSSKRQTELLALKLEQLEARPPHVDSAANQGGKSKALFKLQQKLQRLQEELTESKLRNHSLRMECADITALKAKTMEQSQTIERLTQSLEKMETIKEKAAQKVVNLRSELDQAEHGAWERKEQTQSTLTALGNELRSTRRALREIAQRERQLVDFREFVARALGFDTNSLSVPEERIYARLTDVVQTQRGHNLNASRSDSLLWGSNNSIGVQYVGSRPTDSSPADWVHRSSHREILPRSCSQARC
ncbi:coiled-coil domain-containing protein 170-like [Stegostoma tigrinum]|uniref:coiled-coil domain-containing protein 170-like n=1 Tax=Stegostoma tigrinum TaxID=3053191 RepID=UPI00286FB93B|nr:coiled-coil domain-containing protein 170-like [Stegostoma tigrinum]